jgi:protein subunit release factor B
MANEQIRFDYFKSSGPGGQNKNKRITAVRVVHEPTGVMAVGQETRSQAQNKALALERLKEKLARRRHRPKPRVKTRRSRSSQERRLNWKKKHGAKKSLRRLSQNDL